jgi:hypothetical protein
MRGSHSLAKANWARAVKSFSLELGHAFGCSSNL